MKIKKVFSTPQDKHYFFGYYDKSQLNIHSNKLLALQVDFVDKMPTIENIAKIGYFEIDQDKNSFIELGQTRTFNWQQGCMLQWLGEDFNSKVIYNDIEDGQFISCILDIKTLEKSKFKMPVYTVSKDGKSAICVDNERHYWFRRGYSYDGVVKQEKRVSLDLNDGLWLLSLETNEVKKVVAIQDLLNYQPISNMQNATHYIEHPMFDKSGTRFCFLHRWKLEDGGIYARLYTVNKDGSDLYLLSDSGRVGHFCWRNDKEILMYGGLPTAVNKLRKHKNMVKFFLKPLLPLYHKLVKDNSSLSKALTGDSYILMKDKTNVKKRVALEISDEDGHPSFNNIDSNFFITDTYPDPDEGSIAKLICYHLETKEYTVLDRLNSLAEYDNTALRCDLHPKWSYDGNHISIDTMHDGIRSCYVYKFSM